MLNKLEKKIFKTLHLNLNSKYRQHLLLLLWIAVFVLSIFSYYSKQKQIVFFQLCFYQPWLFTNYEDFRWIHAHIFARVQLLWTIPDRPTSPWMGHLWAKRLSTSGWYHVTDNRSKRFALCGVLWRRTGYFGAAHPWRWPIHGDGLKYRRKNCVSY